jgi:hypothetical protein
MLAPCLVASLLAMAPATAERKGNTVLTRDPGRPVYSFAAVGRVPILVGGGTGVIQPVGFGAGLQFRYHGLRVGRVRLGAEIVGGHVRILEKVQVTYFTDDGTQRSVTRTSALDHTSFALGPSMQVVLGPVILEIGGGIGVGVNNLVRPVGPFAQDVQQVNDVTAVARVDGHLGIPIRKNQGLIIGANFERFFSGTRVVQDLSMLDDPDAEPGVAPFDRVISPYFGYQMWF